MIVFLLLYIVVCVCVCVCADRAVTQVSYYVTGVVTLHGISRSQFVSYSVQEAFRAAIVQHVLFDGGSLAMPDVSVKSFVERDGASACVSSASLDVEYIIAARTEAAAQSSLRHLQYVQFPKPEACMSVLALMCCVAVQVQHGITKSSHAAISGCHCALGLWPVVAGT